MEKIRQGAISVLIHQNKVVFLPLPEEDIGLIGNGGKEKKERARGDEDWVTLTQGMLGFVSGGIKTKQDLGSMEDLDRERIIFETIKREADEEFDLPINLQEARVVRDGVIEQMRYGKEITFLLWVVTRVIIEENNLLRLKEITNPVLVEEEDLKSFLSSEGNNIRPAAKQAVLSAYKL